MRFYGGSLREWLSLSYADLRQLLELASELDAKERLAALVDRQVSSGWAKRPQVMRHVRMLESIARGPMKGKPPTMAETKAKLASLGFKIEKAPNG